MIIVFIQSCIKDFIFSCLFFFLLMWLLENFKLRIWLIFGPHRYRVLEVVLWISGVNSTWCCFVYSVGFLFMFFCVFFQNA